MTINEIMNISEEDISKMTKSELKGLTQKLVYTANKRIERFEQKGIESPATFNKPHFKTRNMTLNQLRGQFASAKNFLNYETSTIRGYRQYQQETVKRMLGVDDISKKEAQRYYESGAMDRLWKAYERHRDEIESTKNASERIQQALIMKAKKNYGTTTDSFDDYISDLLKEEDVLYEEKQEEINDLFKTESVEFSFNDEGEFPW